MAESFPRGRFVWDELMNNNPDAVIPFYTKVAGWTVQPSQDPGYRMWAAKGKPVGGLMKMPAEALAMGAPPSWMGYMAVEDVDASVRQAQALGGRVLAPAKDVMGMRFAVLADPQGAAFGVLRTSGDQGGHDGTPKPGEFSWHEIATTDPNAAWSFYSAMFGWVKSSAMDMGAAGVYQTFKRAGVPNAPDIGGVYRKPAEMAGPPCWNVYINVASADQAAAIATANGGKVLNGPMEVPGGGRIANLMDPQGVMISVHSNAPAAAASKPAASKPAASKPAAKKAAPKKKAAAKPKKKAAVKAKAKPKKAAKAKPKKKAAKKAARKAGKKAARKAAKKAKKAAKKGGGKKGGKKKR